MHTLMIVTGGLVLLAVLVAAGRLAVGWRGAAQAALWFLPLWLIGALANMWVGVSRAGYTVAQEAPIAIVVFLVPALVAVVVRRGIRARF
ncbi:MAG: hypothetical protein BGP06_06205 [Rhizobiales bacterium 65-9]|nr:hypothetical protein [Hyphomicrobiales bacterium]OJY35443.1 MAG: hypothetical protein BGP06_06205 [Rhizobiales bacterium 65-9]